MLGPTELTLQNRVPVEQTIERQRSMPGSGCLVCKVIADGPTRVLQITTYGNVPHYWVGSFEEIPKHENIPNYGPDFQKFPGCALKQSLKMGTFFQKNS